MNACATMFVREKGYVGMRKTQEDNFCKFLAVEREKANITMDDLCNGLYTPGMIKRIECGERKADKMMQDRLLARLGVSSDIYENYLNIDEYELWEIRQKILGTVDNRETEKAKGYLEQYGLLIKNSLIGKQFYLTMKAEILKQEGAEAKEIAPITEKAVKLTVPDVDKKELKNLVLSVQEVNLVLEYKKYCHPQTFEKDCEELIDYVEKRQMDEVAQAKILPKIIYDKWQFMRQSERTEEELVCLLKLCNKGIEINRTAGRLFYFWELLQMRLWCIKKLTKIWKQHGQEKKGRAFLRMAEKTQEWAEVLEELYEEHQVSKEMTSCCYLYWQQETYCVNDVIRIRREILGMTRKELYEGICSEKTLGRIERKQCKPQLEIVKELFKKLHLSAEMRRPGVAAERREAIEYVEKMSHAINEFRFEDAEKLLEKNIISQNEIINRQFLQRTIALFKCKSGKITRKECINRLKEIMAYTFPYEEMFYEKEYYITQEELLCFYNIAIEEEIEVMYESLRVLARMYQKIEERGLIGCHIAAYTLTMTALASTLGNIEKYEESDELSHKIIRECLLSRRLHTLDSNIHSIMWNNGKRMQNETISTNTYSKEHELKKCMALADIRKNDYDKNYYFKELESIT